MRRNEQHHQAKIVSEVWRSPKIFIPDISLQELLILLSISCHLFPPAQGDRLPNRITALETDAQLYNRPGLFCKLRGKAELVCVTTCRASAPFPDAPLPWLVSTSLPSTEKTSPNIVRLAAQSPLTQLNKDSFLSYC
jgi:hypothetical protein